MTDLQLKQQIDCYWFLQNKCTKGKECEYRHSDAALHNQTVCKFWAEGSCTKTDCIFRHPSTYATIQNAYKKATPCYYFSIGQCTRGAACPFIHSPPEEPKPAPPDAVQKKDSPPSKRLKGMAQSAQAILNEASKANSKEKKNQINPTKQTTAPAKQAKEQGKQTTAPTKASVPQTKQANAPTKQTKSQGKEAIAPKVSNAPLQSNTTAKQTVSPAKQTVAPAKQTKTPAKEAKAPGGKVAKAPVKQTKETKTAKGQVPADANLPSSFVDELRKKNQKKFGAPGTPPSDAAAVPKENSPKRKAEDSEPSPPLKRAKGTVPPAKAPTTPTPVPTPVPTSVPTPVPTSNPLDPKTLPSSEEEKPKKKKLIHRPSLSPATPTEDASQEVPKKPKEIPSVDEAVDRELEELGVDFDDDAMIDIDGDDFETTISELIN